MEFSAIRLIKLRFDIIKAILSQKKEVTFDELREIVSTYYKGGHIFNIQDYYLAIIDLDKMGILNVKYEDGFNSSCIKNVGHSIIGCSLC